MIQTFWYINFVTAHEVSVNLLPLFIAIIFRVMAYKIKENDNNIYRQEALSEKTKG